MKIHLYQLTIQEAFPLCKKALTELGFLIQQADEKRKMITGNKPAEREGDVLFFNILFADNMPFATLTLISNIFSGANGTFIAEKNCEGEFLQCLEELIIKTSPTNSTDQSEESETLIAI